MRPPAGCAAGRAAAGAGRRRGATRARSAVPLAAAARGQLHRSRRAGSSSTRTPPGSAPLLLDAFAQPDGKVHPAVVVVHGGGWTDGSRVAHIGQFLELLTEAGYQWVAVDYRLGGRRAGRRPPTMCGRRWRLSAVTPRRFASTPIASSCSARTSARSLAVQAATGGGVRGVALVGGVYAPSRLCPGCRRWPCTEAPTPSRRSAQARQFCDRIRRCRRRLRTRRRRRRAFIAPRTGGRRSGTTSRAWSRGFDGCSARAPHGRSPSSRSRCATRSGRACTSA